MNNRVVIGLDVGARRIGIARGDLEVRLATPLPMILNDEKVFANIAQLVQNNHARAAIVGLPRDAAGEETAQSRTTREFAAKLAKRLGLPVRFQDESLTSVLAEKNLRARKNFREIMLRDGTLDSEAAAIILQDFLDNYPKSPPPKKRRKTPRRRSSFDISRSFVEMNFAVLMEPELTPKELKKKRKAEAKAEKKAAKQRHRLRNTILSILGLLLICTGIVAIWWTNSLRPVDVNDTKTRQFIVEKGSTTDQVATALQKAGFIRNALVFKIYARLNDIVIQAGTHFLSPSYSTPEIAEKLTGATADEIEIQIPPGLTLKQLRTAWKKYGYSDAEIDTAYSAEYDSSLFVGRPDSLPIANRLEGYIYPDTYRIYSGDRLEIVIAKALDQFELVAAQNDLLAQFAAHKLTFYQGVTLASIVVKEVSNTEDQKTVAGVFYNRLRDGTVLGSDVTYHYAFASGYCQEDLPSCGSVYNTRRFSGLPPGPIANVSLTALIAVANPTQTDFYYFVSGDGADAGKTFFSKTESEHEANIRAHCHKLCH